jgi:hypothetical protein
MNSAPTAVVACPDQITNLGEVYQLVRHLYDSGVSFHPDDSFHDIINGETGDDFFTAENAERLDQLMENACHICQAKNVSIYTLAILEFKKRFDYE